ncbi:MAG: methionine--tRNA ligase [Candidatus Methanoplasma sp.]|jgi:methionyl-tRNA synthetase|nr:methionine--tRNA ligase [Candidatus Methanoplasma sp.]
MSKICVNIAWPYANGAIHIGHVAGSLLPPDIFARFNRLMGNEVLVVGGSDQHGTPITVTAEREGVTPEAVAERYHEINKKAIEDLGIEYSLFGKTHCDTHFEVTQGIFRDLMGKGHLYVRETDQYYCAGCARFLPDRYVEGTCPKCGAENVRSDQCDRCGAAFEPGDVLGARCIHCGGSPEIRPSEHYFLRLSAFRDRLIEFVRANDHWRPNVKAFTQNWLEKELLDRAVTRDMSWGVPVPVEGWGDKVIYVWFDAVIGYLSDSIEYSRRVGDPDLWKRFWQDPETRHYYFIGKDNIPFHSIIWPSILMGVGGLCLPHDIPANEFLLFNGEKLSKSRGGAVDVPSVLEKHDRDAVRYYLAANMPDTHDAEFSWDDFQARVNSELVSVLGNFYHRSLSFTHKNFGSVPPQGEGGPDAGVAEAISSAFEEYRARLSSCDFKKALKAVMDLARFGNRHFDASKPWALVKSDRAACGAAMCESLRIARALAFMAWPFLPSSSEKAWAFLGLPGSPLDAGAGLPLSPMPSGHALPEPSPIYKKIEFEKEAEPAAEGPFQAFRRLDLRAARIISAEDHPSADRLFVLKVDVGEERPRQVVAGLKAYYSKEQIEGRPAVLVANLKPAKLRGVASEGMLLAADDEGSGGKSVLLLRPSADLAPGTRIDSGVGAPAQRIEYEEFQKAEMILFDAKDGKTSSGMELGVSGRVAAAVEGGKAMALTDGKGCTVTADGEISDGAKIR